MKKLLAVLLTVTLVATLFATMSLSASAATSPLVRLTPTATDLKLTNDNMSEAEAISLCSSHMGDFASTYAIYSKAADGKYNYLSCAANTGWYKCGTATLQEIYALGGMYGVMFAGTFTEQCSPVDAFTLVKDSGAAISTFNFGTRDFHVCSEDELGFIQNAFNEKFEGKANVVGIVQFYNKKNQQVQIMQFEKSSATQDCTLMSTGECKTFADYTTTKSEYINTNAAYYVADVLGFEMLEGANQSVDLTKVETVTFRSSCDFSKFKSFMIDGVIVPKESYTAKSGSTIIEVKKAYLNTLTNGTHTAFIVSEDGIASTDFALSGATGTTSPKTGDSVTLLIALMAISALGIFAVSSKKQENN